MKPSVCYLLSRVWLFLALWTVACQAPLPMGFSRQKYRVDSHSFLQEIFLTQGPNQGLLHCRQILYHLSQQGSPMKLKTSASSVCQFNLEEMPSWDLIVILNLFTRWFSNMPTSFCTVASWLRFASYNPSSYTQHNDLIFSYCNNCFSLALLMYFSPSSLCSDVLEILTLS